MLFAHTKQKFNAVSTEPVPELDLTTLKSRHRQMRMRTCGLREMKRVTSLGPTRFTQRIAQEYYKQHHQIKHTTSSTKEVRAREGWIPCVCLFCHGLSDTTWIFTPGGSFQRYLHSSY